MKLYVRASKKNEMICSSSSGKYPVKYLSVKDGERLGIDEFPNFSATGSVSGMKKKYYGEDALLVKCGGYIYNVTSEPDIYWNEAH